MKAIHSGFNKIVPAEIVRIFSWKELRDEICGMADVPVDQLRRVAVYEGFDGEKDPSLKFFWKALENFSSEQRCMFLQFVWAKLRVPRGGIKKPFKIIRDSDHDDNPDSALPKSRTCFFELTLPAYTSQEIMSEKLAFSIKIKGMSDHDVGQHHFT